MQVSNHIVHPWRAKSPARTAGFSCAVLGLMLLASCGSQDKSATVAHKPAVTHIITLPRGTLAAFPGSPEDALATFMASNDPPPRTFRFASDQFTPWSDRPAPRTRGTLAAIILVLTNYPGTKVLLSGYTDTVGSAEANLALSQRRVDKLKRLLIDGGVPASAVTAVGNGMADPIGDNLTDKGRAQNRRIELTVTTKA